MDFYGIMSKLLWEAEDRGYKPNHWRMDDRTRMELTRDAYLSFRAEADDKFFGLPAIVERLPSKMPRRAGKVPGPNEALPLPERFLTLAAKQDYPDGRWLYVDHKL